MRSWRAHSPRASRRGLAASIVVITFSVVLFGCPTSVDWSDFQGINLIEERHFGADDGTDPVWTSVSGDFVLFEEAAADAPPLPSEVSATTPVYRMELLNLIPNGDFEDPATGAFTHWNEAGNSNAAVVTADALNSSAAADGVDLADFHAGRILSLNFEDSSARYFIDLASGPVTVPDAFEEHAQFALFVDFRTNYENFSLTLNRPVTGGTPVGADETDEQNDIQITRGVSVSATTSYRFPGVGEDDPAQSSPGRNTMTVGDDEASLFSFGGATFTTQQRNQLLVDNIRLVRSDLEHGVRLVVPQSADPLQPERPALVAGGLYTLSFWIGRDTTTGRANRFDPEFVTVRIATVETQTSDGTSFIPEVYEHLLPLTGLAGWGSPSAPADGGWTRVERTFPGPSSPSFDLEISILFGDGSDPESLYPGSILITDPRLEYRPQ